MESDKTVKRTMEMFAKLTFLFKEDKYGER